MKPQPHQRKALTGWSRPALLASLLMIASQADLAAQGRGNGPRNNNNDRPPRQQQRNTAPQPNNGPQAGQADENNTPAQPARPRRPDRDDDGPRSRNDRPDNRIALPASFPDDVRTIDGTDNNPNNSDWGSANTTFLRLAQAAYEDGSAAPSGSTRLSAREISNICAAQDADLPNAAGATDFFWQWGQFLDHDITLSPVVSPIEHFDIAVPTGDPWFDPTATGTQTIPLERSLYQNIAGVREQVNEISAYIDASNVYGSDEERATALRTLDGTGKLKTSAGDLPPFNTAGLPNAPSADMPNLFLAGDFRANEQIGLTAMHALFVREHNFWAEVLADGDTELSGEIIYQASRAIVAAEMQAITYREFLPVLLGRDGLRRYRGYNRRVNAGISNAFATAAYRVGHTMLSSEILRLDANGQTIPQGNLSLAGAFFRPDLLITDGIDPVFRGLAAKVAQEIDTFCVDEIRNFLFGPPGAGGFDLASLNIQRGRDHGLADYNQARLDYGLLPIQSFAEVHPDPTVQARLAEAFGSVNEVDLWVGGLAEAHVEGALVGETFHAILSDQFERLRDGDRFWYERYLPDGLVRLVNQQTLSRIIRRNTDIGDELPNNVFLAN